MKSVKASKVVGFIMFLLTLITALFPFASTSVLALTTTNGTIIMSNSTSSALLTTQHGGTTNVNGKYVRNNNGEFIPVYCIEHGTHLNTGDTVNRSDLTPENGTITQQSGASKSLTQEEINRIGLIYVCGYNGYNGWGYADEGIASNSATPNSNSNFAKYVATQILIWEVTEGYEMGSNNPEVQRCVDIIRSRMAIHSAFTGNVLTLDNALDGNSIAEVGQIVPYSTITKATENALGTTYTENDGTYHFRYSYPSWINPVSGVVEPSDGASVVNYTASDFTTKTDDALFIMRGVAEYSSHLSDSDNRVPLMSPTAIYLWTPVNGNQLTISAEGVTRNGYLAFRTPSKLITEEYMTLSARVSFNKKDYVGNMVRGAQFDVYSGYSNGKLTGRIGTMNERNGAYDYSFGSSVFGRYGTLSNEVVTKKFYIAETMTGHEVYVGGDWYPCEFAIDNTVYEISIVINSSGRKVDWSVKKLGDSSTISQGSESLVPNKNINVPITWGNKSVVNYMYTHAETGITLNKIDDSGNRARGAEFSVYTNLNDNAIGVMQDLNNDGQYSWNDRGTLFDEELQNDSSVHSATLYVKETSSATQIYLNGEWVDRVLDNDERVYRIEYKWTPSTGDIKSYVFDNATGVMINEHSSTPETVDTTIEIVHIGDVVNTVMGSISIHKVDIYGLESLSGAIFEVYDSNGELYATITDNDDGVYILNGMPVGSYTVQEIEAPINHEVDPNVYEFEITAQNPDVVVDNSEYLGDEDLFVNGPYISTVARSASSTNLARVGESATIIDTVTYVGLIPGVEYEARGELIDKSTGDVLSNSTAAFIPEEMSGSVEVVFDIDGIDISSAVIYETIIRSDSNKCVGMHRDIDDPNQSVSSVSIHTTLVDSVFDENIKHTSFGRSVRLVDKVEYAGLIPGIEYELQGNLVIKQTGEKLGVARSIVFVPEEPNGEVSVMFENVDVTELQGVTLVAFERLLLNGDVIAIHEDINDVNQSITVPEIGTELTDEITGTHMAVYSTETILVDAVSYSGLMAGKTYVVTGILVDKETGDAIKDNSGKEISSTKSFVAVSSGCGIVDVEFAVDSSLLVGKTVVAFEDVNYEGVMVACHADIDDAPQSVRFPELITSASVNGQKEYELVDTVDIVDSVNYRGLEPGRSYLLKGKLMSTEGAEFCIDDIAVTSEIVFIPQTTNGSVDIHFIVTGEELEQGQSLVVFEYLFDRETNVEVATHADLSCENQTVTVKQNPPPTPTVTPSPTTTLPPPTTPTPSTGESLISVAMIIGAVLTAVGSLFLLQKVVVLSNKRKK